MNTDWFLIAYFLTLAFLTVWPPQNPTRSKMRMAWIWFGFIPLSRFFFMLFKINNLRDSHDMALVQLWEDGVTWLLIGFSIQSLSAAICKER